MRSTNREQPIRADLKRHLLLQVLDPLHVVVQATQKLGLLVGRDILVNCGIGAKIWDQT